MKNLLMGLIFSISAFCSYENQVEDFWNTASAKLKIFSPEGFLPEDVKTFLEKNKEEKALLLFYPKRSSFDALIEDTSNFLGVGEIKEYVESLGYTIVRLEPYRHTAHFEDTEELNSFVNKYFHSSVNTEKLEKMSDEKMEFPTKLVLLEVQK